MATNGFRDKIKRRIGIREDDGQFDSDIDDFTQEAIQNLYPIIQSELEPQVFPLLAETNEIDLTDTDIESVRRLEIQNSEMQWQPLDEFTQHKKTVYLYNTSSYNNSVRIHGNGRYTNTDLPLEYEQVILNWAISEFYSLLVGDKRKYNAYVQTTSARSVDNFRDLSDYYLDRGNQLLADRATIRGV